MPTPKKPKLRLPRAQSHSAERGSEESKCENIVITPSYKESQREIDENCKDASQNIVTGVGLEHKKEDIVHDTHATTPTSADPATDATAPDAAVPWAAAAAAAADASIKRLKADVVITRHVALAAGAGLIPLPIVDFAAVTSVQVTMLALICNIYEQPFSKEAATSIIASLAGGAITGSQASSMTIASRLKFIPVLGTVIGFFVTPALAGATTYAIGKVFVHHLASGGTVFTFEAKKLKEFMQKSLQEGKKLVPRWGTSATAAAAPASAA